MMILEEYFCLDCMECRILLTFQRNSSCQCCFFFETRPGGLSGVIEMEYFLNILPEDACALGLMDFIVTRSYFPFVSDNNVSSNPLIDLIFLDTGIISLYIVSELILLTGIIAKFCKNAF